MNITRQEESDIKVALDRLLEAERHGNIAMPDWWYEGDPTPLDRIESIMNRFRYE